MVSLSTFVHLGHLSPSFVYFSISIMRLFAIAALASLAHMASAVGVVGKAEGFAAGVTGGGKIDISSFTRADADFLHQAAPLLSIPKTSTSLLHG